MQFRKTNWPAFCHSTVVRLYYELHHPGQKLPPPTADEQAAIQRPSKSQQALQFLRLLIAFAATLGIGGLLESQGLKHAFSCSLGIFIIVRFAFRLRRALHHTVPMRKFEESQRIWETGIAERQIAD